MVILALAQKWFGKFWSPNEFEKILNGLYIAVLVLLQVVSLT
jgi:hypothetical protein